MGAQNGGAAGKSLTAIESNGWKQLANKLLNHVISLSFGPTECRNSLRYR